MKKGRETWKIAIVTVLVSIFCISSITYAGSIGIINGASGTSESGTTAAITSNLDTLLLEAGHTTTVLDVLPADISVFDQVWDIRFSNSWALTAPEQAIYLDYLDNGGGMFLMGENNGFTTRNNSILSLISAAGGGDLTFTVPGSTQTVLAPFTGPNLIPGGDITYAAPGGVMESGTGEFMTVDANGYGTGVAFSVGDLTNTPLGALTTIFDVNFMQGTYDQPDSQQFLRNLISFVEDQVDPPINPVPEPGTILLMGIGFAGLAASRMRKKKS